MQAVLQSSPSRRKLLDRLGATGSMLCAIHCAALPLVLVLAPAFGAWFGSATFEYGFIAFASVLGLTSLILGYRQHRVGRALLFLLPGIALLWSAVLIEPPALAQTWAATAPLARSRMLTRAVRASAPKKPVTRVWPSGANA